MITESGVRARSDNPRSRGPAPDLSRAQLPPLSTRRPRPARQPNQVAGASTKPCNQHFIARGWTAAHADLSVLHASGASPLTFCASATSTSQPCATELVVHEPRAVHRLHHARGPARHTPRPGEPDRTGRHDPGSPRTGRSAPPDQKSGTPQSVYDRDPDQRAAPTLLLPNSGDGRISPAHRVPSYRWSVLCCRMAGRAGPAARAYLCCSIPRADLLRHPAAAVASGPGVPPSSHSQARASRCGFRLLAPRGMAEVFARVAAVCRYKPNAAVSQYLAQHSGRYGEQLMPQ